MTIDRRSLLQAGLTSAAVGSVSIAATGTAAAQSTSKTYVLVHGAWHGGWCWKEVADGLRGMGHRVTTPTQTGLGERKHLLSKDITLDTFAADVVNHIEAEELNEVILVGHSFGGKPHPAPRLSRYRHLGERQERVQRIAARCCCSPAQDRRRAGARHLHSPATSDRIRYSRESRIGRLGQAPPDPASRRHIRQPNADRQSRGQR
jgi:pimeloyl-ACP methyl ester carboxylesterase